MVNVSNEYLEKINSSSKQVYWYGKVTLKNGIEYDFDSSNLAQGQTSIRHELSASKFGIGGTCSAELKISFMLDYDEDNDLYSLNGIEVNRYDFYEAEITLTFRLYLDDEDDTLFEDVELGSFTVSEPERSRLVLTCIAYDYMQKFTKNCVSELQGSFYQTLLGACTICGVELGNTISEINHMVNGTKTIAEYDPKNYIQTWRDVVGYIAAILCANAIIRNNKLYIIPYKGTTDRYISSENRVSLTLEDYTLTYGAITSVNLRTNTEDKVEVNPNLMAYKMNANPLMQYTANASRRDVLSNILTAINNLRVVPFKSEVFNDPSFEVGDTVEFADNHAERSTKCIVTAITLKLNGHMELKCEGDNPYLVKAEESASSSYGQSTNGAVGDGVTFYDFVNEDDITIADGEEEEILSITYKSNGKYRQELAAELKVGFVSTETVGADTYTENDIDVLVTYYLNGQEILSYHPQTVFTDGISLLHLFYFWNSDTRIPESTFSATITANGGSLTILEGNDHARIMQSGTAYGESSNRIEYIEVVKMPNKEAYILGENLDYTGIIVKAFYADEHSEDITNQCVYDPANGTPITDRAYVNVNVTYTKDGKDYKTAFGLEVSSITSIEVAVPPNKMTYRIGEALDLTGMKVYGYRDDNTYEDVTNLCLYSPGEGTVITADKNSIIINITYNDRGAIFTTVYDDLNIHKLIILDVAQDPTKTEYFVGENIDLTGVKINAEYLDDVVADVTSQCTFSPVSGTPITQDGAITVTATYSEDGITKTAPIVLTAIKVMVDELIVTPPDKTTYREGETLDLDGIEVVAKYNNGTRKTVTDECEYSPNDGSTLLKRSTVLNISYTEDEITYVETVDLEIITFDGIEITQEPYKIAYKVGEVLDYSGIQVTGTWSDNTTEDVTSACSFSPEIGSHMTKNSTELTVTLVKLGTRYTDTVSLELITLESIEVTTPPNKVKYKIGESLDYTGIVVTATYSDNSTAVVTNSCTYSPQSGTTVTKYTSMSVTVSYTENGVRVTDTVELELVTMEGIEITTPPTQTKCYKGTDNPPITGMVVTANWSDGSATTISNSALTIVPVYTGTIGTFPRTIYYKEFSDTYDVEVVDPALHLLALKYVDYTVGSYDNEIQIHIRSLLPSEIAGDNLANLVIPATFEDDLANKTYPMKLYY